MHIQLGYLLEKKEKPFNTPCDKTCVQAWVAAGRHKLQGHASQTVHGCHLYAIFIYKQHALVKKYILLSLYTTLLFSIVYLIYVCT